MVLPEPVLPMIAVVCPARAASEMSAEHRRLGARVVEPDVAQLERAAVGQLGDRRRRARTTDDGVSSTSSMRSAHTAARGTMTATNVAIITAMRIWTR